VKLPSRRRSRPRGRARLALAGDIPDDDQTVTELIRAAQPDDWDGTTITFSGASSAGLHPSAIYGPPQPRDTYTVVAIRQNSPAPPPPPPPPQQVLPPVEITEPAKFGDYLRLPLVWCEIPRCINWRHDIDSLGERDARERAIARGWRTDAFGRLTCPDCQQRDPGYRVTRPVAWHHLEVARRWHQDGQNLSGDAKDELAAEAEYGRRISRRDPALARDIAAATGRHERRAGTR
jgi:hypothetical protein